MSKTARVGVSLLAAVALTANATRAQHCPSGAASGSSDGVGIGIHAESASFRDRLLGGGYEGVAVTLTAELAPISVTARLPAYNIHQQRREVRGLGDASLEGWWLALGSRERGAGPLLSVLLPTGAEADGLGMGHATLAPGSWGHVSTGRLSLTVAAHHAFALGGSAGEHREHSHGVRSNSARSVVDPMSRSELAAVFRAKYAVRSFHALELGIYGAVPTFDADGAERLALFGGPDLDVGDLTFAGRLHLPMTGHPYVAKVGVDVTWRNSGTD